MGAFVSIFSNVTYEQCIAGGAPIVIPYPVATPAQYDAAVERLAGPSVVNASVIVRSICAGHDPGGIAGRSAAKEATRQRLYDEAVCMGRNGWDKLFRRSAPKHSTKCHCSRNRERSRYRWWI